MDKRPDPKPRQYPMLWQAYLLWEELMEMRKRHILRLNAISKGKSHMEGWFEEEAVNNISMLLDDAQSAMTSAGQATGPIWDWTVGIKGIGDSLGAQLIAQVDDIGNFDTVAKLWRFSGYAVIDGKAEKNQKGEKSHYNSTLKGIVWKIGDQFIRHHTLKYREIYDDEKVRQKRLHPEPIKDSNGRKKYTDLHLHRRASRKMVKEFLKDFWKVWREIEGLPLGEPYQG